MSESRTVEKLTLGGFQPTYVAVEWLKRHGVERVVVIPPAGGAPGGLMWQESYRASPELAVAGDVLAAVDLGGTSGALTVVNHGPPSPGEVTS
jgi:hypothetical protein